MGGACSKYINKRVLTLVVCIGSSLLSQVSSLRATGDIHDHREGTKTVRLPKEKGAGIIGIMDDDATIANKRWMLQPLQLSHNLMA